MSDVKYFENWHWNEKNVSEWCKDKITELLTGLQIEDDRYTCKLTKVTKIEGEATANNRRQKIFFSYEWKIIGNWEANLKTLVVTRVYKGRFKVPNLSEEFKLDEVDVKFTLDDPSFTSVKEFLEREGSKKIREQLEKYLTLMREEYDPNIKALLNKT